MKPRDGPRQGLTPDQAFNAALALYRRGALREAETLFRALLRVMPERTDALRHVGALCLRSGRLGEAVEILRKAAALDPNSATVRNEFGIALEAFGEREAAYDAYKTALALDPDNVEANNNLGTVLLAFGRHDEAIARFEHALAIRPDAEEAHNNLGNALAALKRFEEAIAHYAEAIRIRPGFAQAHNNLGLALNGLDRAAEAIGAFEHAISLKPDYGDPYRHLARAFVAEQDHQAAIGPFQAALAIAPDDAATENDLANALATLGRHNEAIGRYRKALALRPDFAEAHNNIGNSLAALKQHEEAIPHYRRALSLAPALTEVSNNLGSSLEALGRSEEAIGCYDAVLAADPDNARSYHLRGYALRTIGRLAESRASFERALALAPERPEFYRGLVESRRFAAADPHLVAMERLAAESETHPREARIDLCFALAKAYDDIERPDLAFPHLLRGNALQRQQIVYDESATLGRFGRIAAAFTPELLRSKAGSGNPSMQPVFILGAARSGSTLVEQILASHPDVYAAGEISALYELVVEAWSRQPGGMEFPESAAFAPAEQLNRLAARYLDALGSNVPPVKRITDKALSNFQLVGLIHLLLPEARIIHTRRDPIDTCLSAFSKLFTNAQAHSFDLGELGRHYRAYAALMAHWRRVLPEGVMIDVDYELLVADFEPQARRLIAHCGLEWDDSCLRFYEAARPVRTASAVQVRQPLYHGSVGRWRAYEPWLGVLIEALGDAAVGAAAPTRRRL